MQTMLFGALVLLVLLALAHSVLGERFLLRRLFRKGTLPKLFGGTEFTQGTLRFVWHMLTIAWLTLGAVVSLMVVGAFDAKNVLIVIAFGVVVSALLPLVYTRGRHLSWVVMLVIACLLIATIATLS